MTNHTQQPRQPSQLLDDGERETLMALCKAGKPLHKLLQATYRYSRVLGESILALDLDQPDQLQLARQWRLERNAGLKYVEWLISEIASASDQTRLQKDIQNG